jgi:hypothetical protein
MNKQSQVDLYWGHALVNSKLDFTFMTDVSGGFQQATVHKWENSNSMQTKTASFYISSKSIHQHPINLCSQCAKWFDDSK